MHSEESAVPRVIAEPTAPAESLDWQPLPPRSRALFVLGTVPVAGAIGLAVGGVTAAIAELPVPAVIGAAAFVAVLGAGFGLWLGLKQYRHTFWRLDAEGLALRRGKLWQRETRVPASRVQHLDLKRGPLQRNRELATVVVHTAGTRNSSVTVPNLDVADAERLRDRLGRQIDRDNDD